MDVKETILQFYKGIDRDSNSRDLSWEHCYKFFQEKRPFDDEAEVDLATLNLAFYLASWGMYRGSSKLLRKDYQVHTNIVREIIKPEYNNLRDTNIGNLNKNSSEIGTLFKLITQLETLYRGEDVTPTNTLITKVSLGTLGCIPAYDTIFINGIEVWKKNNPTMDMFKYPMTLSKRNYKKSYLELVNFYKQHKDAFDEAQEEINKDDNQKIAYPIMKLVDMYFWQLGRTE